jgi:hypothetical protein
MQMESMPIRNRIHKIAGHKHKDVSKQAAGNSKLTATVGN